jgi:fluoroquinolone transport system permease protein
MTSTLGSFFALLIWDFRLQARYYFWTTGIVVTGVWLLLLLALTEAARVVWIPVLIFADICNIGLLFIAGILYLERRQGTLFATAIMPVSSGAWLATKIVSLTLLCSLCASVLVYFSVEAVNWLLVFPAILLNGALFTSFGFLLACLFQKILNYFLAMALAIAVLNLPLLAYLGIFEHELMWLLPSQPALWLLAESFQNEPSDAFLPVVLLLLAWIALIHWLDVRLLKQSIAVG